MRSRNVSLPVASSLLAFIAVLLFLPSSASGAAQEKVLHAFRSTPANYPAGTLIADDHGNLYGTASGFTTVCPPYCGAVFELERTSSGWKYRVLHTFKTGATGELLFGALVFDATYSTLYGTTQSGGSSCLGLYGGCGTVFKLTRTAKGGWAHTVLYQFTGSNGASPNGDLVIDSSGNLYGTTYWGGMLSCSPGGGTGCGTVFELSPSSNGWTEKVLYAFSGESDGGGPEAGVIADASGNLYGGTSYGGNNACSFGCGTEFQLSPGKSGWTESVLHRFTGADGSAPESRLTFDSKGNLYGTAFHGGSSNCTNGCGTAFELAANGGNWNFNLLYGFTGKDGWGPGVLVFDSQGNIWGMTNLGGSGWGNIFELSPGGNGWSENSVYDFTGLRDGNQPAPDAGLILDSSGIFYGTTYTGGKTKDYDGVGVVFELVP